MSELKLWKNPMTTPSKADVLKVAGEPVAFFIEQYGRKTLVFDDLLIRYEGDGIVITRLYTESQLLAMYAAGAEDMRERAAEACESPVEGLVYKRLPRGWRECGAIIRALPITQTNTEGEQG